MRLPRISEQWQTLIAIAIGSFMVVLDTTIVNIALPRIIVVFGAAVDEAQLVITGYLLALAIIMPLTPYVSRTFGSKRMYLLTQVLFVAGSGLCGVSWNVPTLVAARVLQGLGGGMIQPLGMATLFQVTPRERLGATMGMYALPIMVGPILGPTLGGYLVEYVDWRWVFFLNVPVGVASVLLGQMVLKETPTVRGMPFDFAGFGLAAVVSAAALLGLSGVAEHGLKDAGVLLQLGAAALLLPVFVWWELQHHHPLLELRLFAIPQFSMGAILNFITMSALYGAVFLLPVFLQNIRGMGAMETGMLLFPQAIASAVSVQAGGRLYDRVGPRPLIIAGLLVLAASTWLLSSLDLSTPDSYIRLVLVLRGAAMGLAMMPAMTSWMASAPASQTQAASALNNVLRQLFGAFGTAAFATVLQQRITFHTATLTMLMGPDNFQVVQALARGAQAAQQRGMSLLEAKALVASQLSGMVSLAGAVRAFDDCFLAASAVCLLGVIPVFFLRKAGGPSAAPAAME